jgi:chromosome segregation ATPase
MSIVNWLTGGNDRRGVDEEEFEHLRMANAALSQQLAQANDEASALRSHVEQARVIIEQHNNASSSSSSSSSPESEAIEAHIESLQRAHAEVVAQYDAEHRERLKTETELNDAQLALQKAQTEAQHAKNANAVLEQRVELSSKSAEEASENALKIESAKDAEIVSDERQIGDLVSRLNEMKMEQMALKRELASCSTTTQEAHGNLKSIHGFSMDVVSELKGRNV